ncbi:hypothetical protein MMC30_001528 [Trapelia coarctata]|nr:hypothetical protein [Trapelia coarctata]
MADDIVTKATTKPTPNPVGVEKTDTNSIATITPVDTPGTTPAATPTRRQLQEHDDSIVHYENEDEKQNSAYQIAWSKAMEAGPYRASDSYENGAVLLLSWDKDFDDLDVQEEVNALGAVFTDIFHYKLHNECLKSDTGSTPQAQVNKAVADFVAEEDRPKRLLIVYYAGHGTPGNMPGDLRLSPGYSSVRDLKGNLNHVIWNRTENLLRETQGDVLQIFDCCYAGTLLTRSPSTRSFEYLAATGAGDTTPCPGPTSFTSALIWALTELEKEFGRFTTQQLTEKIKNGAPEFPPRQTPILSKRSNLNSASFIMLEPISTGRSTGLVRLRSASSHENAAPVAMTLRVMWDSRPPISEVERFGKALNDTIASHNFQVSRIMWGGIQSWMKVMVAEALNRLGISGSHRRHKRLQSGSAPDALLVPICHHCKPRPRTSHKNALFMRRRSVCEADYEHSATENNAHGVAYHGKMLLISAWVASVSLITLFPEKGRILYGPRAFVSWVSLLTMVYILMTTNKSVAEI